MAYQYGLKRLHLRPDRLLSPRYTASRRIFFFFLQKRSLSIMAFLESTCFIHSLECELLTYHLWIVFSEAQPHPVPRVTNYAAVIFSPAVPCTVRLTTPMYDFNARPITYLYSKVLTSMVMFTAQWLIILKVTYSHPRDSFPRHFRPGDS